MVQPVTVIPLGLLSTTQQIFPAFALFWNLEQPEYSTCGNSFQITVECRNWLFHFVDFSVRLMLVNQDFLILVSLVEPGNLPTGSVSKRSLPSTLDWTISKLLSCNRLCFNSKLLRTKEPASSLVQFALPAKNPIENLACFVFFLHQSGEFILLHCHCECLGIFKR